MGGLAKADSGKPHDRRPEDSKRVFPFLDYVPIFEVYGRK